jgi:hypothetical protein
VITGWVILPPNPVSLRQTSRKLSPKTQLDGAEMLVFAVGCGFCELLISAEKVAGCPYQGLF